jgi:hypothetical protein
LSIASFVAHGHQYDLYCYESVDGVPDGVTLKDGNTILPAARIFGYADGFAAGSPAAFSNPFRYALLLNRGGWWVDTDVVCLRPFDLPTVRVFGSELTDDPPETPIVSTSVLKAPAGDALMSWALRECDRIDTSRVRFGQLGPRLLQRGVEQLNLQHHVMAPAVFSPVHSYDWRALLEESVEIPAESYGLHLWMQMWNAHGIDKDGRFRDHSVFEQLKRRYSIV